MVELINICLFAIAGTSSARALLKLLPEGMMGVLFNQLRLRWKALSKPAKRKGLGNLQMRIKADAK
ncbi:MAG: hypothetical protein LRZ88_07820 [Candidatus Cloacimonetes bacterium]|nr:hypothetical protein [Candidatus Cloacimonadota bacterium]